LASLKNLLVAYSISDSSELGYAQGMTYVAALLLLYMPEEVRMVKQHLRVSYDADRIENCDCVECILDAS
jgi:hypothetical protein